MPCLPGISNFEPRACSNPNKGREVRQGASVQAWHRRLVKIRFMHSKYLLRLTWFAAAVLATSSASGQVPELRPVPMTDSTSALPVLGGGDAGSLSWSDERKLGDRIARQIQIDPEYERDPLLHDYTAAIWSRLLDTARRDGLLSPELQQRMAWKLFLDRDPSVNAFAMPGAYIGVNLGLISVVDSRDEMAAVLAHETAHILQRHIARLYARSGSMSLMSLASLFLGAIAMAASPQAGMAVMSGGQAYAIQNQINFTRDMEREADRIGYRIFSDAGYDRRGMAAMFRKLEDASRLNDTTSYPYLRDHPLTAERIADADMRAGLDDKAWVPPADFQQAMMGARALVLGRPQPDAWRALVAAAQGSGSGNRRIRALYAGALAASSLRDFAQANRLWDELMANVGTKPADVAVARMLGPEISLAAGDAAQAQERAGALAAAPLPELSRPLLLLRAQVALAAGRPGDAARSLQDWVAAHPDDDTAWLRLASAYAGEGQQVLALRAEAESRVAIGDLAGAVDRFKVAQNVARGQQASLYDQEIVNARLKATEEALRQQTRDDRANN